MFNSKLAIGLVTLGLTFALGVAPSFAEFTTRNSKSQGNSEVVEVTLEAGGAKVVCEAYEEAVSKGTWLIEKSTKASTKGPGLLLKTSAWGTCTGSSSEIKSTKAEVGECPLEVSEPSEETAIEGKLTATCTAKLSSCELKMEPKTNEKLRSILL